LKPEMSVGGVSHWALPGKSKMYGKSSLETIPGSAFLALFVQAERVMTGMYLVFWA